MARGLDHRGVPSEIGHFFEGHPVAMKGSEDAFRLLRPHADLIEPGSEGVEGHAEQIGSHGPG